MTHSEFDSYRPPELARKKKRKKKSFGVADGSRLGAGAAGRFGAIRPVRKRGAAGPGSDGSREMSMVDEPQFESYYGRPIVKAPPWKHEIPLYMVLGGIAGGSALLAAGAQLTGLSALRRNTRLTALGAVSVGALALIADLGRPERFLNMMRTVKVTSPMSLGSWVLASFSGVVSVAAANEVDRLLGSRLPVGGVRTVARALEKPSGLAAGAIGPLLAVYTAVLISDTSVPTWNAGKRGLPFVFVSSASLAAGRAAMITTPVAETRPARILAVLGVAGDVIAMKWMKGDMHPLEAEPLETGHAGHLLHWAEYLAIGGGVGAVLLGGNRVGAALSGAALVAASALTRFGIMDAGHASTQDPKYVVEPQKARLRVRRAKGIVDDSIVTVD